MGTIVIRVTDTPPRSGDSERATSRGFRGSCGRSGNARQDYLGTGRHPGERPRPSMS